VRSGAGERRRRRRYGGIGRAVAVRFAAEGWNVAVVARGEDGLAAAARDIEASGGRALALAVDVADAEAVDAVAGHVEEELGSIDVWVNAVMAGVFAPFVETGPEEFRIRGLVGSVRGRRTGAVATSTSVFPAFLARVQTVVA
jgi:NAD(P)-dependent dehydrogenase (short-subunit alcohol dehydrogenase family)